MKKSAFIVACLIAFVGCSRNDTTTEGAGPSQSEVGRSDSSSASDNRNPSLGPNNEQDNSGNRVDTTAAAGLNTAPPSLGGADTAASNNVISGSGTVGSSPGLAPVGGALANAADQIGRSLKNQIAAQLQNGGATISADTLQKLQITSSNGEIILRGPVQSEAEKRAIEQQAQVLQKGATIRSELRVSAPMPDNSTAAPAEQGNTQPDIRTQTNDRPPTPGQQ